MQFIHCLVRFSATLDLASVATLLSERVFGGIPFVETDEFDEVPGMRLKSEVLSLCVRTCGKQPLFELHVDSDTLGRFEGNHTDFEVVNISKHVEAALKNIEQFRIIPT
jgi:hypothetical protein